MSTTALPSNVLGSEPATTFSRMAFDATGTTAKRQKVADNEPLFHFSEFKTYKAQLRASVYIEGQDIFGTTSPANPFIYRLGASPYWQLSAHSREYIQNYIINLLEKKFSGPDEKNRPQDNFMQKVLSIAIADLGLEGDEAERFQAEVAELVAEGLKNNEKSRKEAISLLIPINQEIIAHQKKGRELYVKTLMPFLRAQESQPVLQAAFRLLNFRDPFGQNLSMISSESCSNFIASLKVELAKASLPEEEQDKVLSEEEQKKFLSVEEQGRILSEAEAILVGLREGYQKVEEIKRWSNNQINRAALLSSAIKTKFFEKSKLEESQSEAAWTDIRARAEQQLLDSERDKFSFVCNIISAVAKERVAREKKNDGEEFASELSSLFESEKLEVCNKVLENQKRLGELQEEKALILAERKKIRELWAQMNIEDAPRLKEDESRLLTRNNEVLQEIETLETSLKNRPTQMAIFLTALKKGLTAQFQGTHFVAIDNIYTKIILEASIKIQKFDEQLAMPLRKSVGSLLYAIEETDKHFTSVVQNYFSAIRDIDTVIIKGARSVKSGEYRADDLQNDVMVLETAKETLDEVRASVNENYAIAVDRTRVMDIFYQSKKKYEEKGMADFPSFLDSSHTLRLSKEEGGDESLPFLESLFQMQMSIMEEHVHYFKRFCRAVDDLSRQLTDIILKYNNFLDERNLDDHSDGFS